MVTTRKGIQPRSLARRGLHVVSANEEEAVALEMTEEGLKRLCEQVLSTSSAMQPLEIADEVLARVSAARRRGLLRVALGAAVEKFLREWEREIDPAALLEHLRPTGSPPPPGDEC